MKTRGAYLLEITQTKNLWEFSLKRDIQNEEYSFCECIFEQVCDYLTCNSSDLEVVLFQYFDDNGKTISVSPVAYQADNTPKCIGSFMPPNYKISMIFTEKNKIKYLKPQDVKNGFAYNGKNGVSEEQQRENEIVKQYIAVPLITRENTVIATMQLCFFKEIIKNESDADYIIDNIIRPFGDYIEYILCEQIGIEN